MFEPKKTLYHYRDFFVCQLLMLKLLLFFYGFRQVCCICLAKYENNDELRELPCSHLFHKDCVDKWLKINSLCPLCKNDVGENSTGLVSSEDANQLRSESRIENGLANTSL